MAKQKGKPVVSESVRLSSDNDDHPPPLDRIPSGADFEKMMEKMALMAANQAANNMLAASRQERDALKGELKSKESTLEQLKDDLKKEKGDKEVLTRKIKEKEKEIGKLKTDIELKDNTIKTMEEMRQVLGDDVPDKKDVMPSAKDTEDTRRKVSYLEAKNKELAREMKEKEEQHELDKQKLRDKMGEQADLIKGMGPQLAQKRVNKSKQGLVSAKDLKK